LTTNLLKNNKKIIYKMIIINNPNDLNLDFKIIKKAGIIYYYLKEKIHAVVQINL
jgi:hypothetical protein